MQKDHYTDAESASSTTNGKNHPDRVLWEEHPHFCEFSDARLIQYQNLLQEKIDWAHDYGDKQLAIYREQEMRMLQNERRRRNPLSTLSTLTTRPSQPKLDPEALFGLADEIVTQISPYTEAHDVALLLNSLTAFGNVFNSSAHATVQATEHPGRLFVCLVGTTSKGRKDTSWSPIKYLFATRSRMEDKNKERFIEWRRSYL